MTIRAWAFSSPDSLEAMKPHLQAASGAMEIRHGMAITSAGD